MNIVKLNIRRYIEDHASQVDKDHGINEETIQRVMDSDSNTNNLEEFEVGFIKGQEDLERYYNNNLDKFVEDLKDGMEFAVELLDKRTLTIWDKYCDADEHVKTWIRDNWLDLL
tara:strand:- start:50 stop:391 length:342 start_codon:yes stop_codon:yes gene_type:complete